MKKVVAILLVLAFALTLTACGGGGKKADEPKVMKVGIGVPETHFEYKAMVKFKENVESKTKGAIKVELYPSNQLGNDKEVLEAMKLGTIQMNLPSPAVLANFVKEYNILALPFIFATQEVADKVADGPWGKELLDKLKPVGYVGLGFGDFGFRHTTNNVRPIEKLEDFKGLKIRTMQNPAHLDVFRALGANPTSMGFSEVFSSLQQGVIDGQENPLKNITSNKLHEVQKYASLDGHVYEWIVFTVSKKFYDGLTPDQQKIIQESADIAKMSMRESVQQEDAEALEVMKKAGMKVTEISPAVKAAMQAQVKPVVEKYAKNINQEFYDKMMAEVKKHSK